MPKTLFPAPGSSKSVPRVWSVSWLNGRIGSVSPAKRSKSRSIRRPAILRQSPVWHFEGLIARAEDNLIDLQLADGSHLTFPFEQVDSANLKFEW